jgi:hypothetical protein
MKTALYKLNNQEWSRHSISQPFDDLSANLVLCFSSKRNLELNSDIYTSLREKFPKSEIVICSTAGEIYQREVFDDSLIVTAIQFEKTQVHSNAVSVDDYSNTYTAGIALAKKFTQDNLKYLLIISDGSKVNGSDLVKGLSSQIGNQVLITGGLAGDGANFQSTLVGLNESPKEGRIIAIGLYGDHIQVTHGSQGGWDIFGLEKRVTNASGNVLLELEDQNALDLYKKYLGPASDDLPGSALLFPLSVIIPGASKPIVRTILSINEEDKSMTFAGDIPVGSKVRFMKANFDRLTQAATEAAEVAAFEQKKPIFSLLISCIGRKLVLGDKTVEEVKAVSNQFDDQVILSGFYSYGEISPFNDGGKCQLHNQTMTITSFFEK